MEKIQLFENKKIRTVWDEEKQEWLAVFVGTNCPQVEMLTPTGKHRKTLAGEMKVIFRIIESIPSKKAEPFKLYAQDATLLVDAAILPRTLCMNPASE